MFRIKIAAIIGGAVLAFLGVQEYRVSSGATAEPIDIDLAAVERDEVDTNNTHWRLGEHIALYGASLYQYSQSKYASGEPGPGARVDYCYYPVLSYEHPFIQALADVAGDDSAPMPPLDDFRVLVKTKEYATIGDIPDGIGNGESLQGLVVNLITGLDSEEKELFRDSFPQLDLDRLLIIEAGREPASLAKSLGMTGSGLVIALAGGLWMLSGFSDENA